MSEVCFNLLSLPFFHHVIPIHSCSFHWNVYIPCLHDVFEGKLSWKKFFGVFLVKMNVWMVWNLYVFIPRHKHPVTELSTCIFCILSESFHFHYRHSMLWLQRGTATSWPPTERIVKQRVGIGCSASSFMQTGDPGHCSEYSLWTGFYLSEKVECTCFPYHYVGWLLWRAKKLV